MQKPSKGRRGGRRPEPNAAGVSKRPGPSPVQQRRLVRAALHARRRAVAPYSKFRVGAALLTRGGEIVSGANVESASYGLTCCAERIALFTALTSGENQFVALAVAAPGGVTPCGACRQLLAEFAPDALVWVVDTAAPGCVKQFAVTELMPSAFIAFDPDSH